MFGVRLALAALTAAALVPLAAYAAVPKVSGTTGPGFTITLKRAGKAVRTLTAGRYRITVADRSDEHNFRLRGPGVNRLITGLDFVGTRTVTLRLRAGRYTYVCDPHADAGMRGSFRVRR